MKKVKKITILGSGTAGWMTAAFLAHKLEDDYFELSIIEGKSFSSVGVGEATLPSFPEFLEHCGFKLEDWFNYCKCTHKVGIVYNDWIKFKNKFWHPFGFLPWFDNGNYNLFDILKHTNQDLTNIGKYFQYYNTCIVENKPIDEIKAVHIDAKKLALFFKENVKIKIIKSDITDVLYKDGDIEHIILDNNQKFISDLYIDCLGFKSIIKDKNSSYNFVFKNNSTPINAAIFNPVNYTNNKKQITPYTTTQCTPYGWMWQIPLQNRLGAGSVFNKDLSDKDEVIKWYENYFGKENLINPETKCIEFTPGYYNNQWNGNCISIGLASGFIEPLESTGIQFIIDGIIHSFNRFNKGWYIKDDIKHFNGQINLRYESVFDFIGLHYLKTEHNTPFWKHVKDNFSKNIDTTLKFRLDYMKNYYFGREDVEEGKIVGNYSWLYMLTQYTDIYPKTREVKLNNSNELLEQYLKDYY